MARLTKEQAERRRQELEKKAKLKPDISKWKMTAKNTLVEEDNKIFVVRFDKIFGSEKAGQFNRFIVDKTSYTNQLPTITKYVNYFMNKYDPENDLAMAYYKLKVEMDKYKMFTEENLNEFIDLLYDLMFHPRMVGKIHKLVEDNYLDDIESNDTEGKYKSYGSSKQYLESLEFTNEHVKIMHRISFAQKLIIPVILHFVHINFIKLDRDDTFLYSFYEHLFPLFQGEVNIYNKIFTYIKTKVLDNRVHNSRMYSQREIMGVDDYQLMRYFMRKVIISENMPKYRFNENYNVKQRKYKENVIGFNKTIIKYQLQYFLRQSYSKTITEVTNVRNAEGLSGADKLEMNMKKLEEGTLILSEINAEDVYQRIVEEVGIHVSEEEIDYYLDNLKIQPFQVMFMRNFYASCFGNLRDIYNLNRRKSYHLLILLKKYLIDQKGYNPDKFRGEQCPLAYILTGSMEGKLNNRIIRNNNFNEALSENENFIYLEKHQYRVLSDIRPDELRRMISSFVNTPFTYVSYEDQEMTGKDITYEDYEITNDLLDFIRSF